MDDSWAAPGVKCECIDDTPPECGGCSCPLVRGKIYTIERLAEIDAYGNAGLVLRELRAPYHDFGMGFKLSRFRPLTSTKDQLSEDIALFTPLLKTRQQDLVADNLERLDALTDAEIGAELGAAWVAGKGYAG